MTEKHLTCVECDELFPDYFEGGLDSATQRLVDAHASSCARCQGLIRDIKGITAAAAVLPDLEPSRDLWKGIADRIEPAVLPLGYRREGIRLSRRVIGLAAAALVVISSSITYVATRNAPNVVIAESPRDVVPGETNETGSTPAAPPVEVEPAAEKTPEAQAPAPSTTTPKATPKRSIGGGRVNTAPRTSLVTNAPISAEERALAPEISQLQDMLRQRRNQLDPSTVKVVEDNLALIDAAVKQAREALMRDRESGFLAEQLNGALQKKVELLRTVAMLPSRS